MSFKRTLLILLAACAWPATAAGQQPSACTLKVENAPELRGFRLGMPLAQVRSRLPGVSVTNDNFGLSRISLDAAALQVADAAAFSGVYHLSLEFLDERVVKISASYDNSVDWKDGDQFAAKVAEGLKLPAAWQGNPGEPGRHMKCDGFIIGVAPNHVFMTDEGAYRTLSRRQDEAREKRRQEFRP